MTVCLAVYVWAYKDPESIRHYPRGLTRSATGQDAYGYFYGPADVQMVSDTAQGMLFFEQRSRVALRALCALYRSRRGKPHGCEKQLGYLFKIIEQTPSDAAQY